MSDIDLTKVDEEILIKEVERRRIERAVANKNRHLEHIDKARELLVADGVLNTFLPEHDRTSCSDTNPCNGVYYNSEDKPAFRCTRCVILGILKYEELPEGYFVRLTLKKEF